MKTFTKAWINKHKPCQPAVDFVTSNNMQKKSIPKILRFLNDNNHFDWTNWALTRCLTKKNKIRYAVYAAEQVLDIFEKRYDSDKPRKAILAAKKGLKNPSEENRDAAAAADAAANAAYAAAYAAADADAAADAADAARIEMQSKILEYGIGLLTKKG
jgi:hypothetical protein